MDAWVFSEPYFGGITRALFFTVEGSFHRASMFAVSLVFAPCRGGRCERTAANTTLTLAPPRSRLTATSEGTSFMKAHADHPRLPNPNLSRPDAKDNLQTQPLAEVEKQLASSPDGLTQAEAEKRLAQYGPNEIAEKKTNEILKFLSHFWGPIPWMIEAAVILSAAARHWPDFGIISSASANACRFWEEHQAGNAIAALKATLAIKARVNATGGGSIRRRVNWCPATSSACASATSCRPMRACWTATRYPSTSRR